MRTLLTAILAVLVASAAFAAAQTSRGADLREDDDKFVLENDHVSVWFQGKKPILKVFPAEATGNESAAFEYHFSDVVEYRDLDGDLTPDGNEIIARLNLNKASAWNVTQSEEDGVVTLNLTLEDDVRPGGKGILPTENLTLPDRTARIGLNFTLRTDDVVIEANGTNVAVPSTSIKYDFIVYQWPFVDAQGDRLALQMTTNGTLEVGDEDDAGSAEVLANGTAIGALSWLATAQGTDASGAALEIPVRASSIQDADNTTAFAFTYDLAGIATLVHDPTVGVAESDGEDVQENEGGVLGGDSKVPAGGVLAVAGGVAVAALVARRRRG